MGGMDNLLPAIAGGTIGAILTAFISLIVTHMNNDTQRIINENSAYWQAQREADDAERRATHEHEVWVRQRKEKLYSEYLVKAESIKQSNITSPSTHEAQLEVIESFDILTQPNLLVIASKEVTECVFRMQSVTRAYFTELTNANKGESDWSKWKETPEVRAQYQKYCDCVREVSNAMRSDLGLEPIY